ncbi:hypothetical protein SASPL_101972 [Salvia splendens]|uniref:Uncharacterized protein n=1 Tax=Salvia splendens TaxID=180675 RepID=A0A8X8YQA3_SALSN|nr:hypothetical protein SASPL_101972 [Salvia splendens]
MHSFEGTIIPVEFLYEAETIMVEETVVRVRRDDVYNRLHFLECRYLSFKGLVKHAGTGGIKHRISGEGLKQDNNVEFRV